MTPDALTTRAARARRSAAHAVAGSVGRVLPGLLLAGLLGCRSGGCLGGSPRGGVDGLSFVRCAQGDAPAARSVRVGTLQFTVDDRVLTLEGARTLRIAAFTGPAGAALEADDLGLLQREKPELVFYLGGLGDDVDTARRNLSALAALHVPALFVAGGSDRASVVEAAFAGLVDGERDLWWNASGLRELRIGADRFVIVAGAPLGRYALDDDSCGLTSDDFGDIQKAALEHPATRSWLLSWHAPAGSGLSEGFAGSELGSPDLESLASALSVRGGVYAYPEGKPSEHASSWLVPRLARIGSLRADGSRAARGVAMLQLGPTGLTAQP